MTKLSLKLIACLTVLSSIAAAADVSADVKQKNMQIVSETKGASGVFVVQDDGKIHHLQSGLVCPASFPNLAFWHAEIFASELGTGMDIGCDYGRGDSSGNPISKLTIFVIKATSDMSLDKAFTKYRSEVRASMPNAVPGKPAVTIENNGLKSPLPEFRAESYELSFNDHPFKGELIVGIQKGWIIEIRATHPKEVFLGQTEPEKQKAMQDAVGDLAAPSMAFIHAASTVGTQDRN